MSGHEKTNYKVNIVSLVVLVVFVVILTPNFGMLGAAIASASSIISYNIVAVIYAEKRLGIKVRWF